MPGYVFVCFSVTAWHSCYQLHQPVHPLAGTDLGMKSKHSLYPPSPPVPAPASLRQLSFPPLTPCSIFCFSLSTNVHSTRAETEPGWYRSFGMDPNDSTYMAHLVAQAQAHPAG